MVQSCSVYKCHSRSDRGKKNGVGFFLFPAWKRKQGTQMDELTKRRRMAWISALRRTDITFDNISKHKRVCSLHFHKGKPAMEMYELDPDWAPSLHLGHTEVKASSSGRFERGKMRVRSAPDVEMAGTEEVDDEAAQGQPQQVDAAPLPGVVAPLCAEIKRLLEENKSLKEKLSQLQEENRTLTERLSESKMDHRFFEKDDNRVNYYTGLGSYVMLSAVLTHMLPLLPQTGRKLSPFQMLILTLMRLRLNLPRQHLAHLFSVSVSTVSTVFLATISAMYTRLGCFVNWPDRDALAITMPHEFVEAFGKKVAVIIDCFEIQIERPSNHKAKSETCSNYKSRNTIKYLIGITPNGAISFISKGWGGRSTDKKVTEQCGIIDKLLPGDLVLAGRGFDITDSVGFVCAEVKTPAFRGQRSQLSARQVEETRHIAHLRVHVERVIRSVRNKYTMLSHIIPVKLILPIQGHDVTVLDVIVHVCCALTNLSPSVVVKLAETSGHQQVCTAL